VAGNIPGCIGCMYDSMWLSAGYGLAPAVFLLLREARVWDMCHVQGRAHVSVCSCPAQGACGRLVTAGTACHIMECRGQVEWWVLCIEASLADWIWLRLFEAGLRLFEAVMACSVTKVLLWSGLLRWLWVS